MKTNRYNHRHALKKRIFLLRKLQTAPKSGFRQTAGIL
jgi:hypothetical protein